MIAISATTVTSTSEHSNRRGYQRIEDCSPGATVPSTPPARRRHCAADRPLIFPARQATVARTPPARWHCSALVDIPVPERTACRPDPAGEDGPRSEPCGAARRRRRHCQARVEHAGPAGERAAGLLTLTRNPQRRRSTLTGPISTSPPVHFRVRRRAPPKVHASSPVTPTRHEWASSAISFRASADSGERIIVQ